jgi:predicted ATPase
MSPVSLITRVEVKNYKSLRNCSVVLKEITVLTGQNGSGKSNFLDSLSFLAECLTSSFESAIRSRGGIDSLLFSSREKGQSKFFSIKIHIKFLRIKKEGSYYLKVGYDNTGKRPVILQEECQVGDRSQGKISFLVKNGFLVSHSLGEKIKTSNNALTLDYASTINGFLWMYYALEAITLFNPEPVKIRPTQYSDLETSILKDGQNTASILYRIKESSPSTHSKIVQYLKLINKSIDQIEPIVDSFNNINISFGKKIDMRHDFGLSDMSDGTLRSLSILTALFQSYSDFWWNDDSFDKGLPSFKEQTTVLLEEIESNIHPGAVGVLLEAVREASFYSQMMISTHSPDFLERIDLESGRETVLAVESRDGETIIAPIDAASREIVRRNLYTLGDLLRMNQLEPEQNPKLEGSV